MLIPLAYKTVMGDYTSSSHQGYKGPGGQHMVPTQRQGGGKWGPAMVWSLRLALGLEVSDSRTEPFSESSPQSPGLGGWGMSSKVVIHLPHHIHPPAWGGGGAPRARVRPEPVHLLRAWE